MTKMVHNALERIFTNSLASSYSLLGKKGNTKFADTSVYELLLSKKRLQNRLYRINKTLN